MNASSNPRMIEISMPLLYGVFDQAKYLYRMAAYDTVPANSSYYMACADDLRDVLLRITAAFDWPDSFYNDILTESHWKAVRDIERRSVKV